MTLTKSTGSPSSRALAALATRGGRPSAFPWSFHPDRKEGMRRITVTRNTAAATVGGARRRMTVVTMTALVLLSSLVAVSVGSAAAPVREVVTIDDTFTWDDCGFLVEEHAVGKLHLISWLDDTGARIRQIVTAPGLHITWRNPLTGASVTTANTYVAHKQFNPDGSLTVAFTGLVFAVNGGGAGFVEAGRKVVLFSDGGIELLASSGPSADLCAALTAAIG